MTVIFCVDDELGLMFNGRRQSRDLQVYKRICKKNPDKKIRMNSYSAPLFDGLDISCNDDFLEAAEHSDICFVENVKITPYIDKIDKLILYFWNRKYPCDEKLNLNLNEFILENEIDFIGNSHEKITERIYHKIK